jgi:hypothetical protein
MGDAALMAEFVEQSSAPEDGADLSLVVAALGGGPGDQAEPDSRRPDAGRPDRAEPGENVREP